MILTHKIVSMGAESPFYKKYQVGASTLHCFSIVIQDQHHADYNTQQDELRVFLSGDYDCFISQSRHWKCELSHIPSFHPEPTEKDHYTFLKPSFAHHKFISLYFAQEIENLYRNGTIPESGYPVDSQKTDAMEAVKRRLKEIPISDIEIETVCSGLSAPNRAWCLAQINPHDNPLADAIWKDVRLRKLDDTVRDVLKKYSKIAICYTKSNIDHVLSSLSI